MRFQDSTFSKLVAHTATVPFSRGGGLDRILRGRGGRARILRGNKQTNGMFHFSNGGTCCSPRGKQHISLFETAWDFMKFMKFEAFSTTPVLALGFAARDWKILKILNF